MPDFLNITGAASNKCRFQDTLANWAFTIPNAGGTDNFFPFSATLSVNGQGVPDGGSGVALLGISLVAIELYAASSASAPDTVGLAATFRRAGLNIYLPGVFISVRRFLFLTSRITGLNITRIFKAR